MINNLIFLREALINDTQARRCFCGMLRPGFPAVFILLFSLAVQAQESVAVDEQVQGAATGSAEVAEAEFEETPPELLAIEALPEVAHLVAALSDRSSRTGTLLTMITVVRLLESASPAGVADPDSLQARFRDDRAWLERLASRYAELPVRGSQLDPAAWFMTFQLSLKQETPGLAVSPLGPEDASLMRALFDHGNERLAATVLPEVLRRIETQSPALWMSLIESASVNQSLHAALSGLYVDWFHPWVKAVQTDLALAETLEGEQEPAGVITDALSRLRVLTGAVVSEGPVDELALQRLRFSLLSAFPTLDSAGYRDAGHLLVLATAVDGLQDSKYLAFTESLLWIVSDLLLNESISPVIDLTIDQSIADAAVAEQIEDESGVETDAIEPVVTPGSPIAGLLSEMLPLLSNTFSGEFSDVDPRINASLATVFNSVQYLQGNSRTPARLAALRQNLGDAIAQLVLLIPDMAYYYDQPVRRRIAREIDVCTGPGTATFSREQFDGCMNSLVEMSATLVNKEELSGDSDGPFGSEQLRRELMMPPWQRINFSLGYLHDRFPTVCELPDQPLPNPLEWSSLATVFTWLARQAPVYFQTPENEALLLSLRQQGLDLLNNMVLQVDCFSGEGTGINDPIRRSLANYRIALDELVAGIREAELAFRAEKLKPGADVVLHGDATQETAYRTEELIIGPCDMERICEMSGTLEATRALIGLFPDPYLIADQTGLGSIEICYQNVQWVNRRAVPVRPEDPHVANYFGQLSFDLMGRFHENGEVSEVFGSNFISPDEHHYLFAAATDEVRDDNCPTEWVGSRIVTSLGTLQSVRIVPDRLTYLAAARKKPSQVIEANWSKGAEWRDWFVTGLGVTPYEFPPDESISERVNQYLRKLYQSEQSMIYDALLRPRSGGGGADAIELLMDLQEELTARKALVRAYMNLFYPGSMTGSDEIRASLEGYGSLIDSAILRRFRASNVAVSSINAAGLSRLEQFQSDWNRQPELMRRSGSIASGVAHSIIRLNALYLEFFVLPVKKTENRDEVISPIFSGG
jgi:hypothetical protein